MTRETLSEKFTTENHKMMTISSTTDSTIEWQLLDKKNQKHCIPYGFVSRVKGQTENNL
jgi:hypothetical protein